MCAFSAADAGAPFHPRPLQTCRQQTETSQSRYNITTRSSFARAVSFSLPSLMARPNGFILLPPRSFLILSFVFNAEVANFSARWCRQIGKRQKLNEQQLTEQGLSGLQTLLIETETYSRDLVDHLLVVAPRAKRKLENNYADLYITPSLCIHTYHKYRIQNLNKI